MKLNTKTTCLYGIIKSTEKSDNNNEDIKARFDDSNLFPKNIQYAILLKEIKVYFGKNAKGNKTLIAFQSNYINCISGEKVKGGLNGGDILEEEVEIKEIKLSGNDYINNFEFDFDDYITYIKISSKKGKEMEFGDRPEKLKKILNYEGDNMIQFFWGDSYQKDGITAIGFKYNTRKNFIFGSILPIIKLRYLLNHNKEFKEKYQKNYKELLKDAHVSMIYLLKTCLLPETIFSNIIKYC